MSQQRIRVIAIGASAGSLEPIEEFFSTVGTDTGCAFIIVQHLSPDYRSLLPELLERRTSMPISVIAEGTALQRNHVYLNPPRMTLRLAGNSLHLQESSFSEQPAPISEFFVSVAQERGAQSIGIVMSGAGTDGSSGAAAMADADGNVFAQDPETARFDSMPRAALLSSPRVRRRDPKGLAKIVEQLAQQDAPCETQAETTDDMPPETAIFRLLQLRYGLDFSHYKENTIARRVERRAQLCHDGDVALYARELAGDMKELESLYRDLLIGVTSFFRDAEAFDHLKRKAFPALEARLRNREELRIWIPGCASGEEAYTIAILLSEYARELEVKPRVKILATDIHPASQQVAAKDVYPIDSVEGLPEEIVRRYFTFIDNEVRVASRLREMIIFARHNLIGAPPFTRIDLISCRNLLIYLKEEAQNKCLALFHFALKHRGVLFLGPSETVGPFADEFETLDAKWRIFQKSRDSLMPQSTRLLPITSDALRSVGSRTELRQPRDTKKRHRRGHPPPENALLPWYQAAFTKSTGASILVTMDGTIEHVFSDAGKYLRVADGAFSNKLGELLPDDLHELVQSGIEQVRHLNDDFVRTQYRKTDDKPHETSLTVRVSKLQASPDPTAPPETRLLIQITEETPSSDAQLTQVADHESMLLKRIDELEQALKQSEVSLQATTEDLDTTNEELQSANEELRAANEELQTVNEELHAMNEELFRVSTDHKSKIRDLQTASADLETLLRSTDIGVLYLDQDLAIRRVTPIIAKLFNIVPHDEGRPLGHITSRFEFDDLEERVCDVMRDKLPVERNIFVDGRDYLLRILPYFRGEAIRGAVLTFVDVTDMARANRSLTQFADIASHDLKAPLRGITMTSKWIIEDLGDMASEKVKEHALRLAEQTRRLSVMLTELREFSSLGRVPDDAEDVDLRELLEDIGQMFEAEPLQLMMPETALMLRASPAALRLVFQNLIDNAVKHGGANPTVVMLSVKEFRDHWEIRLADNGKGIDPIYHERIFMPFRKLQPPSESPGTGIGLSLVQKIIEDHGGSIQIQSNPAEAPGTTFAICWPRHVEQ